MDKANSSTQKDSSPVEKIISPDSSSTEKCVVLAELCNISYSLSYYHDINDPVNQITLLNTLKINYGYVCIFAIELVKDLIYVSLFTTRGSAPEPTDKFVMVFRGYDLPEELTSDKAITSMTKLTKDFSTSLTEVVYVSWVMQQLNKYKCDNVFVTGHNIGGMVAEVVSSIHNLPGIAFCSAGLMENDKKFIKDKGGFARASFQCIESICDVVGNINSLQHMNSPIRMSLFYNPNNRSYAEIHSIDNIYRFFNRAIFNKYTNISVSLEKSKKALLNNAIGKAADEKIVNKVYTKGSDLTMKEYTLDMYIIDLTVKSRTRVANTLKFVMQAVNDQLLAVYKYWSANGVLIDGKASALALHKDLKAVNLTDPIAIVNEYTNIIAKVDFDWTRSGLIYLVDALSDMRGGHNVIYTQGFSIPIAIVAVDDDDWSLSLSHEAIEMLINPRVKRFIRNDNTLKNVNGVNKDWEKQNWELEVSDPCPMKGYHTSYSDDKTTAKVKLSDFVLPIYFDITQNENTPLNYMGIEFGDAYALKRKSLGVNKLKAPFPLLPNGYIPLLNPLTNQRVNLQADDLGNLSYDSLSRIHP